MTFPSAAHAGQEDVLPLVDEAHSGELEDQVPVELCMKREVERLEGLSLGKGGVPEATLNTAFKSSGDLGFEQACQPPESVFVRDGVSELVFQCPGHQLRKDFGRQIQMT